MTNYLYSMLLSIAIMLYNNFGIIIPWLPTPPKVIPIIQMERAPAGANSAGIIDDEWMRCEWLQKNFYSPDQKALEWAPDYEQQMDGIAAAIMAHPKGERAIFDWHCFSSAYESQHTTLLYNAGNACLDAEGKPTMYTDFTGQVRPYVCPFDFSAGVKVGYEKWKKLLTSLKSRGVTLDYFVTENEQGMSYWGMNHDWFEAIKKDPRFPAFAQILGFTDIETFDHDHILRFNAEIGKRVTKAWMDSVYKAMLEVYPNLKGRIFDYAKFQIKEPYHAFDFNGWEMWMYSEPFVPFVTNSPDMSLECAQLCTANTQFPTTGLFPRTNWNEFIYAYNVAAATALSNKDNYFWPLIGPTSFHHNNPYYRELHIHMALMGAVGYVFWNPTGVNANDYEEIQAAKKDVDHYLAFADRKSLVSQLTLWQSQVVESCATANKKKVCRHTEAELSYWTVDGVRISSSQARIVLSRAASPVMLPPKEITLKTWKQDEMLSNARKARSK